MSTDPRREATPDTDAELPPSHGLPDSAFRELRPGEVYRPVVPPGATLPEVTTRSILFGLAMTLLFSLPVAYVALKLGQGIESAIPIAILAIGYSALPVLWRRSTILENVNNVTFGATGIVVGGSVFVMPAIYVLGLESRSSFFQIFLVPLLGAALGVLFLIPFRRYFVADMHGKLPFPEATATTEILVAGDRGGKQARVLLYAMGIGMLLDFLALNVQAWRDTFSTAVIPGLHRLTDGLKEVFDVSQRLTKAGLPHAPHPRKPEDRTRPSHFDPSVPEGPDLHGNHSCKWCYQMQGDLRMVAPLCILVANQFAQAVALTGSGNTLLAEELTR